MKKHVQSFITLLQWLLNNLTVKYLPDGRYTNISISTININMRKLSQRELLEEGFLDAMRATGQLAAAGAKGIAKIISPTGARVVGSAANAVGSAYANFKTAEPKKFVKQELKMTYYRTFNPKSIEILQSKKDTPAPVPAPAPYLPKEKVTKSTNRTIVSFKAERFIPTGGTAPPEIYYAYVVKGGKNNEFTMDVRDAKGNQIQGEKSKKAENPTFNNIIKQYQSKGTPITVALLSTIITKNLGISERAYASKLSPGATDMDAVIMDITNKTAAQDVLGDNDIKSVYQVLETRGLTEKVNISQRVLI